MGCLRVWVGAAWGFLCYLRVSLSYTQIALGACRHGESVSTYEGLLTLLYISIGSRSQSKNPFLHSSIVTNIITSPKVPFFHVSVLSTTTDQAPLRTESHPMNGLPHAMPCHA